MRLAEVSQMCDLLNRDIRVPLAGLRDLRPLFETFGRKQTVFEPEELIAIADCLSASGRLREFFDSQGPEMEALKALGAKCLAFESLISAIDQCIGPDLLVRDSASDKLQDLRHVIRDLEHEIQNRFREIVSKPALRQAVENDHLLMRHGRPVVALKANYRSSLRGTILDRSNTGATLYVEPETLIELSNELEDAHFEENKEIGRILWELTHLVIEQQEDILQCVEVLGAIDLTFAKAQFSIAYHMTAPQINTQGRLVLRNARHPLLLTVISEHRKRPIRDIFEQVVPITSRLGDDFDLILITGPNAGGKTVFLKTIGLCSLMAQSGLHIPVSSDSHLPVYTQIFVDIGDEQSIQQNLSTFSAHMDQIARILHRSNRDTLVLLDELGAGTDPAEGASLAIAILEDLLNKGCHTIVTTHLGQLKTFALKQSRAENASMQFDPETLEPTYRLLMGTPGTSNALAIAKRQGMPNRVRQRAGGLMENQTDGTQALFSYLQTCREQAEQLRQKAHEQYDRAQRIRQRCAERLKHLQTEQQCLQRQADEEIHRTMRQIRTLSAQFLKETQHAPKRWQEPIERFGAQLNQLADNTSLAKRHEVFVKNLRRGDPVYVIPFHCEGTVERLRYQQKTVTVFVDNKQLNIALDQIAPSKSFYDKIRFSS